MAETSSLDIPKVVEISMLLREFENNYNYIHYVAIINTHLMNQAKIGNNKIKLNLKLDLYLNDKLWLNVIELYKEEGYLVSYDRDKELLEISYVVSVFNSPNIKFVQ